MPKMKRAMTFLVITLFLSHPLPWSYAENETVTMSLSDCVTLGLTNNLDVKIARIEAMLSYQDALLSEAIFDTLLAGRASYSDDERAQPSIIFGEKTLTADYEFAAEKKLPTGTELSVDYSDNRTWTDSAFVTNNPLHTAELSFSARQPVLKNIFGYVDRKQVRLAKINAAIADIRSISRIEGSIARIEKGYWDLVFAYQNVALRRELLKQAEDLYKIFKGHLEIGMAEETEIYETEANMRARRAELLIAENGLENASNNLKLMLNEDGNFRIVPEDQLRIYGKEADLVESLTIALQSNREYRIKKKELEQSDITLKMKENSLWPEVDLVGTFAVNGVDRKFEKANRRLTTSKHPMYYAGVEVSYPLENTQARSEFKKAGLEKEKAITELVFTEKSIITDIDEKVRAVNLHLNNSKRWGKIKNIQENKFKDEEEKIKYGRSSSKNLVDYQDDIRSAAIREYAAILEYYRSLIDLEDAKDTLLESIGIE